MEELEEFPQIRQGHAQNIEELADLLDITMINLQEAGQHHELGFKQGTIAGCLSITRKKRCHHYGSGYCKNRNSRRYPQRQFAGCQASLQNHNLAQHLDRGTNEHFSVRQILSVIRRKGHALIVERIMAYGTVQNSIEEKWQIDGFSLNIINYAFDV